MRKIAITVDQNDADYNTSIELISDEELHKIQPLIDALNNFEPYTTKVNGLEWTHHHNYPMGEYAPRTDLGEKSPQALYPEVDDDAFYIFEELVPYGEHGFHSIVKIELLPTDSEIIFKRD